MKRIAKGIGMIILMLVLGEVLFIFLYLTGSFYEHEHLFQYNSNAKLVYTNTATYMTKYDVRRGGDPRDMWVYTRDMDGVYWGSLFVKHAPEYSEIAYDGSSHDLDLALKCWQGSSGEGAGYYFVLIRDGIPEQVYWSRTDELLRFAERFAERAKTDKLGADVYNGGEKLGGYPEVMTTVVKEPPEWLDITAADIIRRAGRTFAKNLPMFLMFVFPLFVYALIRLVRWCAGKIKRKNILGDGVT